VIASSRLAYSNRLIRPAGMACDASIAAQDSKNTHRKGKRKKRTGRRQTMH
jgi:hypothetical protein